MPINAGWLPVAAFRRQCAAIVGGDSGGRSWAHKFMLVRGMRPLARVKAAQMTTPHNALLPVPR
jgi:hypothetical protein